ncbi:MAG: peptidylprolyl isomerase [Deltaproteobacteria bacterium]|nr:peptidylprolyl isomerase [Deltaproteobacteria bacterium]
MTLSRLHGDPRVAFRFVLVVTLCTGLLGCLGPKAAKDARELRAQAEAEARADEEALSGVSDAAALLQIARLRDARTGYDELVQWTRHPASGVRAAAARALAFVGEARAGDVLIHLLEDEEDLVVRAAAFGLGQLDFWRTTELELGALRAKIEDALRIELEDCRAALRFDDGRTEVCRVVARSLGAVGEESAEDALWGALEKGIKPDALRRAVPLALAVQAKAGRGQPITQERLTFLAPLLIASDDPAQWAAAYLLGRAEVAEDAQSAAAKLLSLAWSRATHGTARVWLLRAMGKIADDESIAILATVLAEPTAPSREVVAATRAASHTLRPGLVGRLDLGPPSDVAAEVVSALARLEVSAEEPDASVRHHLAALITSAPEPVLLASLGPLVASGWEVDRILPLLASPDARVRRAAAAALSGAEDDAVDAALLDALAAEPSLAGRIDIAAALAERPATAIEGALLALALDPDPILGAIAADGLASREGAHITQRLGEAWDAASAPDQWERRLSLAKALLGRDDVSPERVKAAVEDPEPLVRAAAEEAVIERFDRAKADPTGRPRPLPDLGDRFFGVGDVTAVEVTTSRGALMLDLYPRIAPGTVSNFVALAERDWFDGLVFHRVVEDFVIQTGDPIGNGWGGPGTTVRCDTSEEPYRRGTLGMALSGRDTGGSQWFITHSPQPHLDGRYAVFGQLTQGWDVLDSIEVGDTITDVRIVRGAGP